MRFSCFLPVLATSLYRPGMFSEPSLLRRSAMSACEDLHRVRHRAAPHPAVQRVVEDLHLDVHLHDAAQLVGERGHAGVEVRGVGEDDVVRGQHRLVLLEELAEVLGADLLLALDDELDVARQPGPGLQVRGHGGDVGHAPALVVGGAAAVQAAAALGGLEGRGLPLLRPPGRLHVVVAVEQDRGRARAGAASRRTRRGGRPGCPAPGRSRRRSGARTAAMASAERRTSAAGKPSAEMLGIRESSTSVRLKPSKFLSR